MLSLGQPSKPRGTSWRSLKLHSLKKKEGGLPCVRLKTWKKYRVLSGLAKLNALDIACHAQSVLVLRCYLAQSKHCYKKITIWYSEIAPKFTSIRQDLQNYIKYMMMCDVPPTYFLF